MLNKIGAMVASGAVVAVLVQGDVVAAPAPSPADRQAAPLQDFVGGGGISAVDTRFGFAVYGDRTGYGWFRNYGGAEAADRKGEVFCVRVLDDEATFGLHDPSSPTPYRMFYVRDNGEEGDLLSEYGNGWQEEPQCADPTTGNGLVVQEGGIVVQDVS